MTISISWLSSGSWLSISRSLAIVSMVTITISMTISKTISMTIITISRLGLSRPLAIVPMVAISISMSITMAISMTIVAIFRLGNSHTQEGKRNSKQKFHVVSCSFSTATRVEGLQFINSPNKVMLDAGEEQGMWFVDVDGSLTGTAGANLVGDSPVNPPTCIPDTTSELG